MNIIDRRTYTIQPYNPEWIKKFNVIKERFQEYLGSKALLIEHVGSTSIPGMMSKPLIDVLIVVKDTSNLKEEIEHIKSFGYTIRKDVLAEKSILFEQQENGEKTENIHLFEIGAQRIERFLNVRDYLRTHPDKVKEYGNLKEKLNKKFPDDYMAYRAGKHDFLQEIDKQALEWKNSKSKTIGIDMDDVLMDFNAALFDYHNKKFGTNHKKEDAASYYIEKLWGYTVERTLQLIQEFYYSDHHIQAPTVEGSIEGIKKLSQNNTLHIVTARPELLRKETEEWIHKHFKHSFKHIHFTRRSIFEKNVREKSDICKELGIEMFIEDSRENALSIAEAGIPVFLLDTPWNKGELPSLVTRVKLWKEIVEKLR